METNHLCLLKRIEEQELQARKFGFYWENLQQLIDQIQSECKEVQEAWNNDNRFHLQEEIGDLIQAAISLAVFCGFDPHHTLLDSIEKFKRRYELVVQKAFQNGYENLKDQPFDVLMDYWKQAKDADKNKLH